MSGHSKWATTKRAKAIVDAKRGAAFTKLANIISIAAKEKGGDPTANFSLRMAIDKAKAVNMPKDNIERAIKRGTGELQGDAIEELVYEAIGPANSQFVVKCLTDNKNRAAANVRHMFSKHGGSFSAVMWNFDHKGIIRISSEKLIDVGLLNNEDFELELIDAGAEDLKKEEEGLTIITAPTDLQKVKELLESKNIEAESAELEYLAKTEITPAPEDMEKIEKIIDELEESEDVSDYYTNVK